MARTFVRVSECDHDNLVEPSGPVPRYAHEKGEPDYGVTVMVAVIEG